MRRSMVVLVLVLLAGCGGGGDEATTTTTEEETTTTEAGVSVDQAAAAVAGELASMEDAIADVNANACTLGGGAAAPTICTIYLQSLSYAAMTLGLTTDSLFFNEDALNHLGPPPEEIEELAEDTVDAAESLGVDAQTAADCAIGSCVDQGQGLLLLSLGEMEDLLAAWAVYT